MRIQLAFLVFALTGSAVSADCPPPEIVSPCTCWKDYEGDLSLYCANLMADWDIGRTLSRISDHVTSDTVFYWLTLRNNNFTFIPGNVTANLKFITIELEDNDALDYISPNAFLGTAQTTNMFTIRGGQISNETEIFQLLNNFANLTSVSIRGNPLGGIPAHAFLPSKTLWQFGFTSTIPGYVGDFAFANLSNLMEINLYGWSALEEAGISQDAFSGLQKQAKVDLADIPSLDFLDERKFKQVLEQAPSFGLEIGGKTYCDEFENCSYMEFYCDSRIDWICKESEKYRERLWGYHCKGYSDDQIWDYCDSLSK